MSASAMKSRCFWPPESVMNQASRFSTSPSCSSSRSRVDRPAVERRPQIDRLPDLDPLLELRFLELHADAMLQAVGVAHRIAAPSTEMAPRSGDRSPSTHSIVVVFPAPFGPISPKISPCWTSNDTSATATVGP